MSLSISDIEAYFTKIGFHYKSVDGNKIRTGFGYPIPYYISGMPVEIISDEYWMTARGIVLNRVTDANFNAILAYIATANARLRMFRMMVASGKVLIQGELIRSRSDLNAMLEALEALIRYGASHALEISAIAANQSLADAFVHIQKRSSCVLRGAATLEQQVDFDILANRLNGLRGEN